MVRVNRTLVQSDLWISYSDKRGDVYFCNGRGYERLSPLKSEERRSDLVMQNPNQMISKPMIYDEVALGLQVIEVLRRMRYKTGYMRH